VQIQGTSAVELFGRQVLGGTVAIGAGSAVVDGALDLFPGSTKALQVRGTLHGTINAQSFQLQSGAEVDLAGMALADAQVTLTQDALTLTGQWLDRFHVTVALDSSVSHTRLTGSAGGSVAVDVAFGEVWALTSAGRAKLADAFSLSQVVFSLDLVVTADEVAGVMVTGRATFTAGARTLVTTIAFPTVPTSLAQVQQLLQDAARALASDTFTAVYQTAEAWVAGIAARAFVWTSATDAGRALKLVYGKTPDQALALLQQLRYDVTTIAQALTTYDQLVSHPEQMLSLLTKAGFPLEDAGRALGAVLAPSSDSFHKASAVVGVMAYRYSALDQIKVAKAFGLQLVDALKILSQVSKFDVPSLIRAAENGVYQAGYPAVATALGAIGIHV
jgi:hypothetical protein